MREIAVARSDKKDAPRISIGGREIVCTNTAPLDAEHPRLTVLSAAPALAGAISRIHNGESVSALFH